jgi:phospholipid/cholesterol/gamma-HCH transport system substrate-binding protein
LPVGRGPLIARRLLVLAAIALAIVVVALLLFGSGSSYTVHATLENASQLIVGDQVKVGGVPVGSIDDIELDAHGQARLTLSIDDHSLVPLHQPSLVEVRSVGLASIAGRYITLTPGPNNGPKIPAGGEIRAQNSRSEVDLDEVLNSLDPKTLGDLRAAVRGLGQASGGKVPQEFNAAIHDLNPALSQTATTAAEIVRDQPTFERFLLESADTVGAVASRSSALERGVPAAGQTLSAIASQTAALDSSLRQLPPTLREANTTLVNLRSLLIDARPAVREARPVAPLLNEFLTRLQPVAQQATAVVPNLRALIDSPGQLDLLGVLRTLPSLADIAEPALESGVKTTKLGLPIIDEIRPYTPDLVGGQLNGFGGTTSTYYDANGRYTRISFQGSGYTLDNQGTLVPQPPTVGGLTGYRKGVLRRCPGAATQTVKDKSNPWIPRANFPCRKADSPK